MPQNGLSFMLLIAGEPKPPKLSLFRMMLNIPQKLMPTTLFQPMSEFTLHQNSWEKQMIPHYVFPMMKVIVSLMIFLARKTIVMFLSQKEKYLMMAPTHKLKSKSQKTNLTQLLNIHSDIGSDSTSESPLTYQSTLPETTS